MKRHTLFIYMATMLTMFGIVLPMSAQNKQKQDALYIYRNDGGFNGFFYGEIDRFEYSRVDTFGVEHDDFVVQEIWARDTVYRIPISAIDSIGFVTPENVYKADVAFTTESDIWNYVIKSDSLTHFVLSANTPSSLIPKVGDKITKTEKTSNLPYGIYGQVVSVDKRADGIAVIFDEIPVGELFDEYTGKFAIRSVSDDEKARSRTLIDESWDEEGIEVISHEVLGPSDFLDWVRLAGTYNFDKKGNFSVGGDFMVRWKTTSIANFHKVGFIRSNVVLGEHINLHIEQEVTSDFNFNLDGSVNFNAQLPFNPKVPLPIISTPLRWYLQGGFFANYTGDLSVKEIEHDKTKSVYDFEYSSPLTLITTLSAAAFVPVTAPLGLTNAVLSSKLKRDVENIENRSEFSFNTSSTLKMGIFVKFGIVFLENDLAELSARGDVGVKVACSTPRWMDEYKYIPESLNDIKNPTGNYDNLKNIDYAENITPYVSAQFSFTVGPPKWNLAVSTPSLEKDLTSFKRTYVPIFSDVEVANFGDSDPNLFARAKVSGPAQNNGAGQEVGFALYNTETNKLISADIYENRYIFADGKPSFTDFSMSIPLKGEKGKLRLYPIVDTNGTYGAMLATPYRDIDLKKEVIIELSEESLEFEAEGGTKTLTVKTNQPSFMYEKYNWPNWLDVEINKDFTMKVTADPNTSYTGREYTIKVYALDANGKQVGEPAKVKVTQKGARKKTIRDFLEKLLKTDAIYYVQLYFSGTCSYSYRRTGEKSEQGDREGGGELVPRGLNAKDDMSISFSGSSAIINVKGTSYTLNMTIDNIDSDKGIISSLDYRYKLGDSEHYRVKILQASNLSIINNGHWCDCESQDGTVVQQFKEETYYRELERTMHEVYRWEGNPDYEIKVVFTMNQVIIDPNNPWDD